MLSILLTSILMHLISSCGAEDSLSPNIKQPIDINEQSGFVDPTCAAASLPDTTSSLNLSVDYEFQDFIAKSRTIITEQIPPAVEIFFKDKSYTDAAQFWDQGKKSFTSKVEYYFEGLPLCSMEGLVYQLHNELVFAGDSPKNPSKFPQTLPNFSWPEQNELAKKIAAKIIAEDLAIESEKWALKQAKKCLNWDGSALSPMWDIDIEVGELPFRAVANLKTAALIERRFLNLDVKGSVYFKANDGSQYNYTARIIDLKDITSSDYLCNERFVTAYAKKHVDGFVFVARDPMLSDVTLFYNANKAADWFSAITAARLVAPSWHGPQIKLLLDLTAGGRSPEARYFPPPDTKIKIGFGDNRNFVNLEKDPHVITHEIGHHIFIRRLTSVSGVSVVIHEGGADAFVTLKNDDPCVAQSICPQGGKVCISTKCLRSADNTWNFTDPNLPKEPHLRSQIISGLVWDIRKVLGIEITTNILYHSVEFFPSSASYKDFISALVQANKQIYSGTYTCTIFAKAEERGFGEVIKDINGECS